MVGGRAHLAKGASESTEASPKIKRMPVPAPGPSWHALALPSIRRSAVEGAAAAPAEAASSAVREALGSSAGSPLDAERRAYLEPRPGVGPRGGRPPPHPAGAAAARRGAGPPHTGG